MKKIFLAIFLICFSISAVFAASSSSGSNTKSNYDQAVKVMKKRFEFHKNTKYLIH